MRCWTCHEPVSGAVCVGCGAVQPPPPKPDPFAVLGLAPRYHLDAGDVEERYRSLARQVHPDRFVSRPAVERRMALQWTAAANDARRVLKDPVRRAWQLATGRPTPPERGARLDPAFLAEMFELREAEEEAPGSAAARAAELRDELEAELDALFTTWERGEGDLAQVEDRLSRLNYVADLAHGPRSP
jgi:molecular chaperone HscB